MSQQNTQLFADWIDWPLLKDSVSRFWSRLTPIFPYVLLFLTIVYTFYYIYSYYYELYRRYRCISIKNIFDGKVVHCFDPPPEYCHNIDPDLYWGWCLDPDLLGAYPGDTSGPYGLTCNQWLWNPLRCPPAQCKGNYPIGLRVEDLKQIQEYGWCADEEINKAIRGNNCGPSKEENISCRNWIWNESQCPKTCPIKQMITTLKSPQPSTSITTPQPSTSTTTPLAIKSETPAKLLQKENLSQIKTNDCSLVCGLQNGKKIPCPPPDCKKNLGQCKC